MLFNDQVFVCGSRVTGRISFIIEYIQLRKGLLNDRMYANIAFLIYNRSVRGSGWWTRESAFGSSSGIYLILFSVLFLFL